MEDFLAKARFSNARRTGKRNQTLLMSAYQVDQAMNKSFTANERGAKVHTGITVYRTQ